MRVIEKKRPPLMTKRRWITIIILFLIVLITLITLYYRIIHQNMWKQESVIENVIKQSETYDFASKESLYKYVWENAYSILLANKLESEVLTYSVWDEASLVAELPYDQAKTSDDMRAIVERMKPNATDIKLQAGFGLGQFVWEVKYRDRETSHLKIAFYNMTSGLLIDEYTIPKDSMPVGR